MAGWGGFEWDRRRLHPMDLWELPGHATCGVASSVALALLLVMFVFAWIAVTRQRLI